MIVKDGVMPNRYLNYDKILIRKKTALKVIYILLIMGILFTAILLLSKSITSSRNTYSRDTFVAEFKTDINKLWEVSKVIEWERSNNSNLNMHAFGSTGNILSSKDINQNLKGALLNVADSNNDNKPSEDELKALGIMNLDEKLYSKELKRLQYYNLSVDNNLNHYVIVTQGKYAGTILYNGGLKFADSNNKCYYGVELFEQQ